MWYYMLIPAMLLTIYAQIKVKSTYNRYANVSASTGMTAAQVARRMLDMHGLYDVRIEQIGGSLTDNYDPRSRVLHLSQTTCNSSSVAAIGVAAHECGHAIQHAESYGPLKLRSLVAPLASLASRAAWLLVIVGLVLQWMDLVDIGVICFCAVVLFYLVTLPVEFNASNRALRVLEAGGFMGQQELSGARSVLSAAALTYVAAALTAISQLLRLLAIANSGRRR